MTEPETKDACIAVQVLCRNFAQKFMAERDELAKIAFQSDGMDPTEWSFDTFTGKYTKLDSKLAPQAQE
jgi:hypothetical protein